MKRRDIADRGQVLIIFVFAIVGLIGMTGIAIDGGNVYSDRRHAQNAADTAALAGALTKIKEEKNNQVGCSDVDTPTTCGAKVKNAARDMAAENGYDGLPHDGRVTNEVEVHIPPTTGPYSAAGCGYTCNPNDYIEVIITSHVDTWFAKVLGIQQLHNRVQAVAIAKYRASAGLFSGSALVSMAPTGVGCPGEFQIGGNSTVTLHDAGIFVNSNNRSCAFNETNCSQITADAGVNVVGGSSQPSSCTLPNTIPPTSSATPVQWPPDPLFDTPSACNGPLQDSLGGTWNVADQTYHYPPGHYREIPPDKVKNITLQPGIYCVDDVIKLTSSGSSLYGTDVFIWIQPGGAYSLQGGTVQLSGATFSPYAGFLIYADGSYTGPDWVPDQCVINGNSLSSYTGVIYSPYCHVTLNGTTGSTGWAAQIIAYTIKINGGSDVTMNYQDVPPVTQPEIFSTGLFH